MCGVFQELVAFAKVASEDRKDSEKVECRAAVRAGAQAEGAAWAKARGWDSVGHTRSEQMCTLAGTRGEERSPGRSMEVGRRPGHRPRAAALSRKVVGTLEVPEQKPEEEVLASLHRELKPGERTARGPRRGNQGRTAPGADRSRGGWHRTCQQTLPPQG